VRKRKLRLEELLAALESQLQPYWTIQKKVFDDIEQNKKNVSDALVWNRLWELTKRGLVAHHYNPHRGKEKALAAYICTAGQNAPNVHHSFLYRPTCSNLKPSTASNRGVFY